MNFALRIALLKRFGSQIRAARRLGMQPSKLSYILHGHVRPSERELTRLRKALGQDAVKTLVSASRGTKDVTEEGR